MVVVMRSVALAAFAASVFLVGFAAPATALVLEPTWTTLESAGGFDLGQGVAVAPDGGVIVTGTTEGQNGQDVVTVRLDADGTRAWRDVYHHGARDRAEDVVTDAEGAAYLAGAVATPLGDDALVRKLSPEGNAVWTTQFDKGTSEAARAIALDGAGNVYVAGVSLSMNGADAFVAKFDANGEELWARAINNHYVDEGFALDVADDGAALVAGRAVRDGELTAFVTRVTKDGAVDWTQHLGPATEARGVAAAPDGATYVTGTIAQDDGSLDAFAVRLSSARVVEWQRTLDVGGEDEGREAKVDPSGNLLVSGFSDDGTLKSPFLLKLDPRGEEVFRHLGSSDGISGAGAVATSPDGARIAIAGAAQREGADFDYLVAAYDQGRPTARFYPLGEYEAGASLQFIDESEPGLATLASWAWSFGDGAASTERSPTHVYEYGGAYTVTLAVRDAYNNVALHSETLVIDGPLPTAALPGAVVDADDEPVTSAGGASGEETPAPRLLALVAAAVVASVVWRRR